MTVNKTFPEILVFEDLGGLKKDIYPIENPETDLSAKHWNLIAANMAAISMVLPKQIITVDFDSYGTGNLSYWTGVWGNITGNFPNPVFTTVSPGTFTLQLPTTVSDLLRDTGDFEYANAEHNLNINWVLGSCGKRFIPTFDWTKYNTITIHTEYVGNLTTPISTTLVVMVG